MTGGQVTQFCPCLRNQIKFIPQKVNQMVFSEGTKLATNFANKKNKRGGK